MQKLAVRWNTCGWVACSATMGMSCVPDDPVPITPIRFPVKSTPSCGQSPLWNHWPSKVSSPGNRGTWATARQPVAMRHQRAVTASPRSVVIVQLVARSSKCALTTLVSSSMCGRSSYRSATWFR